MRGCNKGAAHIEIIISMVLFIGFVMFVFYFFNPIKSSRIVDSSLPYLFNEINGKLNVELETYSVKIDEVAEVIKIEENIDLQDKNIRVENYYETKELPSAIIEGKIYFKPGEEKFVLIKICEDLEAYTGWEAGAQGGTYTISYVGTRDIFSEKKAKELNQTYFENYAGLKDEFNLIRTDFAFSLVFSDSEIKAERFIPAGTDVFSEYKRKEVLRESGELEFVDLIAMVW